MTTTSAQGFISFSDGSWAHLQGIAAGAAFTDTSEAEMYVRTTGASFEQLQRSNENKVISRIAIQLADGSILTTAKIYDAKNGVVAFWRGAERNVTAPCKSDIYDLDVRGLSIPVLKGTTLKLNCAD
jgi:hypothetical protein